MKIELSHQDDTTAEADLLLLPVAEAHVDALLEALSEATSSELASLAGDEGFRGQSGKTFLLRAPAGHAAKRLALLGVGDQDSFAHGGLRKALIRGGRLAHRVRARQVAVSWPELEGGPASEDALREIIEGFSLGNYTYDRYQAPSDDRFPGTESLTVHLPEDEDLSPILEESQHLIGGVSIARDLVNMPPNDLYPDTLAQHAVEIAGKVGLEHRVLNEDELHSQGFGLILGVGQGSAHPPRLVHLIYRPEGEVRRTVAFVGKGVTFDTGGYNLKPGAYMLQMHSDMAGAAAVLGAAHAIGSLKPEGVEVHFITPTAENSVSGNAIRPQDILRGYGKKTVEILNTDAEGRLLLADALTYAQEHEIDTIVDLATLTGACVVALGEETAGLFSNHEELVDQLLESAASAGESIWRMPLTESLDRQLDSNVADMANVGKRMGGAITAALFLKRWVELDRWAHLDIAGPAYRESDGEELIEGGTGFAVSTLTRFIQSIAARHA